METSVFLKILKYFAIAFNNVSLERVLFTEEFQWEAAVCKPFKLFT